MSAHRTARFGITGYDPTGSDLLNTIDTIGNTFLDQIDADMTGWSSGVIASRPTAGTAGRVYLATDDRTSSPNGTLYFDNGTMWVIVPMNNYAVGVIASRPRTGTRGQFYYATDDTTAGPNGTLYLFDGTGWNQVQTGGATALSTTLAARVLATPSGTVVSGSLTAGIARQPNVSRPTLVNAQITVGTTGTGGATAELRIGSTSSLTGAGAMGQVQWITTLSQTTSITGTVSCVVPAGYYYVVALASSAGTGSIQNAAYREQTL